MKAEELKIGNWVRSNGHIDMPSKPIMIEIGFDIDHSEHFSPIELTEDWLERFGIKKSGTNERYFLNHHGFCLSFDDLDWCLHLDPDTHVIIAYCRHVHQLQNLFFAITGEELTVKN